MEADDDANSPTIISFADHVILSQTTWSQNQELALHILILDPSTHLRLHRRTFPTSFHSVIKMDSDDLFSMLPGSSKPAPSSIAPIASSSAAHHATPKSKKKRSAPVSDEDPSERIRDVVMDDEGAPSSKRDKKDRKRKKKARLSEVEEGNGLGNGNGNVSGEVTSSQSTPKVKAAASAPIDPMEALDEEEDNMSVDDSDSTTASHVKALAQASGDQTIDDADMDLDSDSEDDANKDLEKKMPIITDEFNQESEREVVGSSGFAMVNEQETMRLKHNVEHRVSAA